KISISNTSADPYGTASSPSVCTFSFFGLAVPPPTTSGPFIQPGTVYTTLLSQIAPGFSGYTIAYCGFPQARGYAMVSDAGFRTDGAPQTAEVVTLPRSTTPSPLLFSAVSNWNGVDTSITISNTSSDIFGTAQASGTCTISYYGNMANGGSTPVPQTSAPI